jgi:CDP-diacylglycerol--glycerol-3-phosphate 3-phosphatidyltransferase
VTLPDQLTLARAVAVPIVVVLFAWDFPDHAYWATAVFAVAMATDQIDGWLARRRNQTSAFGSLLDPIADKVLVLAMLVMLIGEGVAPAWMVAAIVAREIAVSGLRLAAIERGVVMGARDLGKLKTWAQALAATLAGLQAAGMWDADVAWWALLVATLLTWISGLDYARVAPRVLRGERAASERDASRGSRLSTVRARESATPACHQAALHTPGSSRTPASAAATRTAVAVEASDGGSSARSSMPTPKATRQAGAVVRRLP